MSELITEMVGGEPYQYCPLGDYVVRAVGVCGGRPTFKYTRIKSTGRLNGWLRVNASRTLSKGIAVASRAKPLWKQCDS